jgi:hypothetical protein
MGGGEDGRRMRVLVLALALALALSPYRDGSDRLRRNRLGPDKGQQDDPRRGKNERSENSGHRTHISVFRCLWAEKEVQQQA